MWRWPDNAHIGAILYFLTKLLASRKLAAVAAALIFLTTAGAGVGYATLVKDISLSVDGDVTEVRGLHSTVGDVLESEGIEVGKHDVVQPAVTEKVKDGQRVIVRYGRELRVNVDGQPASYWTTETTLDAAIRDLGLRLEGAELSASRSAPLGRSGLSLRVTMPKDITVTVDGSARKITTTDGTLAEVLEAEGITMAETDTIEPAIGTAVTHGLAAVIKRIKIETKTESVAVAFATTEKKTDQLYKGQTKTETKGVEGSKDVTTEYTYTD